MVGTKARKSAANAALKQAQHAAIAATLAGVGALLVTPRPGTLVLNVSASVPIGIYKLRASVPARGELALVRLPEPERALAVERGYLAASADLIKPVAAATGAIVCRLGEVVTIDGHAVACASNTDSTGRPLPSWSGCHRLGTGQIFVLASAVGSFDSRYLGLLDERTVRGTLTPILTQKSDRPRRQPKSPPDC